MMQGDPKGKSGGGADRSGIQTLEEDLFTLDALAPELLDHVPALFEETVTGALTYMLGSRESRSVLEWFRAGELKSRQGVFARLVSVYGEKASPLVAVIDRTFGIRVHDLIRQLN